MQLFDSYDQTPILPPDSGADLMAGLDISQAGDLLAEAASDTGMWGTITDSFNQALTWAFGDNAPARLGDTIGQGIAKLDTLAGNPTAQKLAAAMLPAIGQAYSAHSLLKEKQRAEDRQQEQQTRRAQWAAIPPEQFKPVQSTGLLASAMAQAPQQQAMQQLALQQKLKEVR